jgi:hypothetical protein
MNTTNLIKQYLHFLNNQQELSSKYPDYYLLIQNQKVVGAFETSDEARRFAATRFIEGTYLIQYCTPFGSGWGRSAEDIHLKNNQQQAV